MSLLNSLFLCIGKDLIVTTQQSDSSKQLSIPGNVQMCLCTYVLAMYKSLTNEALICYAFSTDLLCFTVLNLTHYAHD